MKEKSKLFDEVILETKYFIVAQDWEIAIPGFFIVSPKRKIRTIMDFTDKEAREYIMVVKKVRKAMYDILKIKDVYFFQDEGPKPNFHLWMLPRYKWMDDIAKKGAESLGPVEKFAKKNMSDEKSIKKTKAAARKMRRHLN